MVLDASALDSYRRDGFLFLRRALLPAEAQACQLKIDDYIARFGDEARGGGQMRKRVHLVLRWVAELARNSLIVDAVEDIIGPDILCWSTSLFTKEAHTGRFVSWHQDANY